MRVGGRPLAILEGAVDANGEDGRLLVGDKQLTVQVVSIPADPRIWRELGRFGTSSTRGSLVDAIAIVRAAFEKKREIARGTLLVLNAAHLGAVVGPLLIAAYLDCHGDPVAEFTLAGAWLAGASAHSTFEFRRAQ